MTGASMVVSRTRVRRDLIDATARLARLGSLSEQDCSRIQQCLGPTETLAPGRDLVREDGGVSHAGLIVSGWACRQRLLTDGRRQIYDFLSAGDFVGLSNANPLGSTWTVCLTRVELADAEPLRRLLKEDPHAGGAIARAFSALERAQDARLLDQVVRLGRYTAYERAAHLLLELHERAEQIGFADGGRFPLPLTQEMLADALGLSVVHVNRVLQQLKRDRLIELHGGYARLLNMSQFALICDFMPAA
jgi:CRP-like cAMP-binding protein